MNSSRLLFFLSFLILTTIYSANAQRYVVENGDITFISKATIENIKSINQNINSIFSLNSGNIAFSAAVRDFVFEKQLMEEHFNDKYMESQKFPTATFAGKIKGFNPSQPGIQNVEAKGKLIIHGVSQDISVPGVIEVKDGHLNLKSTFKVKLIDYGVKIPKLLWQNIAEQVDVTINLTYKQQ